MNGLLPASTNDQFCGNKISPVDFFIWVLAMVMLVMALRRPSASA